MQTKSLGSTSFQRKKLDQKLKLTKHWFNVMFDDMSCELNTLNEVVDSANQLLQSLFRNFSTAFSMVEGVKTFNLDILSKYNWLSQTSFKYSLKESQEAVDIVLDSVSKVSNFSC